MLSTIVTIAAAVGGLIIAGLSAYAAYKKSTNKGTHTLTTTYGQYGVSNQIPTNTCYNNQYSAPVIQPVQQTGNIGIDVNALLHKVNEIVDRINKINEFIRRMYETIVNIAANRQCYGTPSAPVSAPIMNVVDTTASEANNQVWEDSGDEAVAKINNGVNPAVETTPVASVPVAAVPVSVPTHTTRLPVSEVGINALNCNYTFNMANGFDQFYDSDLYRRVTADRYQNFQQPKYCDMGDPYGGLPASITGGVSYQINPYATPVGPVMGYPSEPIVCDKPKDLTCHYGHVGLPNPSTRQSYHYGNI